MSATDSQLTTEPAFPVWTASERESFFDAITRHRRAATRVAIVSHACAVLLALVVATLMSPLCYAVIGLALDVMNLLVPMPNLLSNVTDTMTSLIDDPASVSVGRWFYLALIASLPGLGVMALAIRTLDRVMREAMSSDAANFGARVPNGTNLGEQQFADVVAEMAIAAGLVAPRVLVADSEAANAAAFGGDGSHVTMVVTSGLMAELNRAELQGIAAHLVGSVANGDISIGARMATVLSMFGLIAKLSESFARRDAARRFAGLLRSSLKRGASVDDGELAIALTNPFKSAKAVPDVIADGAKRIPWRTIAWMPLVGPLVISGFFGGVLCSFALGPLLSLAWRRRKYLADATAVRLTRDPNTLGSALEKMRGVPAQGAFGAWIAHMSVMPTGLIGAKSILGGSSVPMSPSLDGRLHALGVMGAQVAVQARRQMPLWAWCALLPVIALLVVLLSLVVVGLLYISLAMSGLFTWLPALIVHGFFR